MSIRRDRTEAILAPADISVGSLGSYTKGMVSGIMAAGLAANSPVFSFRYTGSNLCILKNVWISAGNDGTAFAAGSIIFNGFVARSFTVADSGGTAGTLTGNNSKLRTSQATTGVGNIMIASTATLTPGTRTKDTDPHATIVSSTPATAGTPLLGGIPCFLVETRPGEWAVVLVANEGYVIEATVPATGTWRFGVFVEWDEIDASWLAAT